MRKHNFNAGPSILPLSTLENTAKAVLELENTGMSILEISHRSKEFEAILDETIKLFKEILSIPEGYSVLFLGGGCSLQFAMIPYNFMNKKSAYVNSGVWAGKALSEAKFFGDAVEIASSKDKNFSYVPKGYSIPTDADYLHVTTNNTIFGTQMKTDIDSPIPVFADASSDILSRPIDISKYGMVYGGAQKNLGPAGVAFVIVKDELVGKKIRPIPTMLDYKTHIENNSLYNTPPVFAIYACYQTLKWIKSLGGIKVIEKMNIEKAALLYDAIDNSKMFKGTAAKEDRSLMNICFVMQDQYKDLDDEFINFCKPKGITGIKGHRSVGGFRASTYNALPKESVIELVKAMKEFETLKLK